MKKILIVGATHGHEKIGLLIIDELKKQSLTGVEFLVGNPDAAEKDIPFLESDLNRVFPGKLDGTYEEKRAFNLSPIIKSADIVIDIHSTKTTDLGNQSMVIVTSYNEATQNILAVFKPPKVLYMRYKANSALISQAKIGIAFEYGKDDSSQIFDATLHDIMEILVHADAAKVNPYINPRIPTETEVYEVYDAFQKEFSGDYTLYPDIQNFTLCQKDAIVCTTASGMNVHALENFYPILFGNNRYTEILGFKSRKM